METIDCVLIISPRNHSKQMSIELTAEELLPLINKSDYHRRNPSDTPTLQDVRNYIKRINKLLGNINGKTDVYYFLSVCELSERTYNALNLIRERSNNPKIYIEDIFLRDFEMTYGVSHKSYYEFELIRHEYLKRKHN